MKAMRLLLGMFLLTASFQTALAQGFNMTVGNKTFTMKDGDKVSFQRNAADDATVVIVEQDGQMQVVEAGQITFQGEIELFLQQTLQSMTSSVADLSSHCDFGYGSIMHARDVMTADMITPISGYNWFSTHTLGNLSPVQYPVSIMWSHYMTSVNKCNLLIQALEALAEPTAEQRYYLGIAKAYRALNYLDMARMWEYLPCDATSPIGITGADLTNLTVPILTEPMTSYEAVGAKQPRATRQEVAAFIADDLTQAEQNVLFGQRTSKRLPDLAAVYGLKARLYLWLEDYTNAQNYARKAIDLGTNHPLSTAELLDVENGFNSMTPASWMWGVQPFESQNMNLVSWPSFMVVDIYGYASVGVQPRIAPNLYAQMGDQDARKQLFKVTGQEPVRERNSYYADAPLYSSLKFRMYGDNPDQLSTTAQAAYPLMRIEEMYLIEAEAAARIQPSKGRQLLEAFVRDYRDPAYSTSATTADEVVDAVFQQKRLELWGEGQIFFDYKRLNKPVDRTLAGDDWDYAARYKTTSRPAWMNIPFPTSIGYYGGMTFVQEYNNPTPTGCYLPEGGINPTAQTCTLVARMYDDLSTELTGYTGWLNYENVTLEVTDNATCWTLKNPFATTLQRMQMGEVEHQLKLERRGNEFSIPEQDLGIPYNGATLVIRSTANGQFSDGILTFPKGSIVFRCGNDEQAVNTQGRFSINLNTNPLYVVCALAGSFHSAENTWQVVTDNDGRKCIRLKFYHLGDADELSAALVPSSRYTEYFQTLCANPQVGAIVKAADDAVLVPIYDEEEIAESGSMSLVVLGAQEDKVIYRLNHNALFFNWPNKVTVYYQIDGPLIESEGSLRLRVECAFSTFVRQGYVAMVEASMTDDEAFAAWQSGTLEGVYTSNMTDQPAQYTYNYPCIPKAWGTYRPVVFGEMVDGTKQVLQHSQYSTTSFVEVPSSDLQLKVKTVLVDDVIRVKATYQSNELPTALQVALVPREVTDANPWKSIRQATVICNVAKDQGEQVLEADLQPIEYAAYLLALDATGKVCAIAQGGIVDAGEYDPWTLLGQGMFDEAAYFGFMSLEPVEIFQCDTLPSLYRIESPFPRVLRNWGMDVNENASEFIYVRVLSQGEELLGQTVPADDMVYFYGDGPSRSVNTGYTHYSYNDDVCLVFPGEFPSLNDPSVWTYSRVTDRKADGTVGSIQLAPFYYMFNTGGWNYTQQDNVITIDFPGYIRRYYGATIECTGQTANEDNTGTVQVRVTLEQDVASAKVVMVPGNDPNAAYNLIASGDASVRTITASSRLELPYTQAGKHVVAVQTYDAASNERKFYYTSVSIAGSGGTYTALFQGNYYHRVQSYASSGTGVWSQDESLLNEGSILYGCDQDASKFKIAPWVTENGELVFTMDDAGVITVEEANTGYENGDTYIAATDIKTAGLANIESTYEGGTFTFALAWHDMGDIEAGFYGFTQDTFVLTAQVENAPAKKAGKRVAAMSPMKLNRPLDVTLTPAEKRGDTTIKRVSHVGEKGATFQPKKYDTNF